MYDAIIKGSSRVWAHSPTIAPIFIDKSHSTTSGTDCNVAVNSNEGCGVKFNTQNSYGHDFNLIQGGFYAMERSSTEVKVWFWPRTASNIPGDVLNGESTINTNNWVKMLLYLLYQLADEIIGATSGLFS
jgi:hypothetical protein